MNPETLFCLNLDCPSRGQIGQGNIVIHSQTENRCKCTVCGDTFAATKGTIFYRLRTQAETVILVLTLLANGCPTQAVVKAFGFDERTIKRWWMRAGEHCESFHKTMLSQEALDLEQVQADEIKAKTQGGSYWMAMAMLVRTRLWLGGVISAKRDKRLIQALANQIQALALCRPLLLAVDGLPSYVTAFRNAFRSKLPRLGLKGRPKLVAWPNIAIVQVVKQRVGSDLRVDRRIVQGSAGLVESLITRTQAGSGTINTAFIERLNATFRQRLHWLTRRSRSLAHQADTLSAGMFIVGALYNFSDTHHSLRLKLWLSDSTYRWVHRTPAIAAGLTDHVWSVSEVFNFRLPPPRWSPPKRRGRPSKETLRLVERWCS